MKKLLFVASVATIFISGCDIRNQDKPKKSATDQTTQGPEVKLEPTTVQIIDTVYNFNKVKEGEIVEYNYRFKNTGDKPLVISETHASCGCTVPEKPDHPIQPGEMGFIKVKFNSDKRPGEAHKTISVTSNANPEFPTLELKGTVIGKDE